MYVLVISVKSICLFLLTVVSVESSCSVSPLTESLSLSLSDASQVILSATVRSFYLRQSRQTGHRGSWAGKIRVRRVFRGSKLLEGKHIVVEGLGAEHICSSTPKLGETKVFFLRETKKGTHVKRFTLSDDVREVNLKNLKLLWKLENRGKGEEEVTKFKSYPYLFKIS